jgi:hypothetical protein
MSDAYRTITPRTDVVSMMRTARSTTTALKSTQHLNAKINISNIIIRKMNMNIPINITMVMAAAVINKSQ